MFSTYLWICHLIWLLFSCVMRNSDHFYLPPACHSLHYRSRPTCRIYNTGIQWIYAVIEQPFTFYASIFLAIPLFLILAILTTECCTDVFTELSYYTSTIWAIRELVQSLPFWMKENTRPPLPQSKSVYITNISFAALSPSYCVSWDTLQI